MSEQNFVNYVCAAYPLLLVRSYEEYRVLTQYVLQLSKTQILDKDGRAEGQYKAYVWDVVDGVRALEIDNKVLKTGTKAVEGTEKNPIAALDFLAQAPDNTVLFLKDYHPYLTKEFPQSVTLIRKIRNLVPLFNAKAKTLVFLSPTMTVPVELEKNITVIDFKLPDKVELQIVLKGVSIATGANLPSAKDTEILLDAALGMTAIEAENAFSVSLVEAKKFDAAIIRREKAAIVKKSGLLEVIETTETLDNIGGLEIVKEWIINRKNSFTPEARAFGVIPPRALLFLGIAGCGKSLLSKAIALALGRPLLRMDMSRIMDKWVGGSEGNMRACLEMAEAVSPAILWMDEIEKGLAGNSGGSGQEGHEVTRRVFGMLLTWLQEKKKDVILVATANSISSLPPELISRFSASFWVDLPDAIQRKEIIKIHLKKVGRSPTLFTEAQLDEVVRMTEHFNGRELEGAVQDSITRAFSKGHSQVKIEDLKEAAADVTPVSLVKKTELDALRRQAKDMGTKEASIKHESAAPTSGSGSRKVNINPNGTAG
jgi:SpoVK/Ycf46/Vps4 family AAA+-type ATPase